MEAWAITFELLTLLPWFLFRRYRELFFFQTALKISIFSSFQVSTAFICVLGVLAGLVTVALFLLLGLLYLRSGYQLNFIQFDFVEKNHEFTERTINDRHLMREDIVVFSSFQILCGRNRFLILFELIWCQVTQPDIACFFQSYNIGTLSSVNSMQR